MLSLNVLRLRAGFISVLITYDVLTLYTPDSNIYIVQEVLQPAHSLRLPAIEERVCTHPSCTVSLASGRKTT